MKEFNYEMPPPPKLPYIPRQNDVIGHWDETIRDYTAILVIAEVREDDGTIWGYLAQGIDGEYCWDSIVPWDMSLSYRKICTTIKESPYESIG